MSPAAWLIDWLIDWYDTRRIWNIFDKKYVVCIENRTFSLVSVDNVWNLVLIDYFGDL